MNLIEKNVEDVKNYVDIDKVKVLAVTKYVGEEEILQAYDAGMRNFAENKIQDAMRKKSLLPQNIIGNSTWHFIGHLQSNKVKDTVGNFEYIHSIDSVKLATLVSNTASSRNLTQKILIQVNTSEEDTKFGFDANDLKNLFGKILELDSIEVHGFMTMAPFTGDEEVVRKCFVELRNLRDYLQDKYQTSLPELSMGMSNDYKIAVQEGATMIRLGRVLFK